MKRAAALLVLVICLGGCGGENRELQRGLELRSRLLAATGCSFAAQITADYGDKRYSFGMDCESDDEGNVAFTVTAPETIAGIGGMTSNTGGKLIFDDTALHFDLMADGQLSPVSAPWILVKTLRSGYLTCACMEDDLLRLTIDDSYEEDALQLDIWINEGDQVVRCEILYDGKRILSLDVRDFQIL